MQKQVDYMESHPECGMVFADCDVYHNRFKKVKKSYNYLHGFKSPMNLNIEQVIGKSGMLKGTCTVMVRRDLYDHVIDRDPYLHQSAEFSMGDTQLWAELSLISEVTYVPECLATYRFIDESTSRSKDRRKQWRFWRSAYEMRLYLCEKHKLSENIRKEVEEGWCNATLRLAFHERNANLALEVKKKKQKFTWEDWLRYYGTKNLSLYYICRLATLFRSLFRKMYDQWP
jgi:hypothetical protein